MQIGNLKLYDSTYMCPSYQVCFEYFLLYTLNAWVVHIMLTSLYISDSYPNLVVTGWINRPYRDRSSVYTILYSVPWYSPALQQNLQPCRYCFSSTDSLADSLLANSLQPPLRLLPSWLCNHLLVLSRPNKKIQWEHGVFPDCTSAAACAIHCSWCSRPGSFKSSCLFIAAMLAIGRLSEFTVVVTLVYSSLSLRSRADIDS